MRYQFVKTRLYSRVDNRHKCDGILVKEYHQNTAKFYFVFKHGELDSPNAATAQVTFTTDGISLVFEGGNTNLTYVMVSNGFAVDSFETLVLSERARTSSSVFSGLRIILGDEVFADNGGVFNFNMEDMFISERRNDVNNEAVLIKTAYTQSETYSGFSSYHHNQRIYRFNTPLNNDKPYRIGVELEVYARNLSSYNKITTARTNWFQCEADGSLCQAQHPIEIKTIPLRPCDATSPEFWEAPMRKLYDHAVSKQYSSTGLHVHIGKEIFGTSEAERKRNLANLCLFYTYYVEDDPAAHAKNVKICGREQGYNCAQGLTNAKNELADFAQRIGFNFCAERSMAAFQQVSNAVMSGVAAQRWDVNTQKWDSYGTVEFRKGKGCISFNRISALCAWWETMCLYVKETRPQDYSFEGFFTRVCHDHPVVASIFRESGLEDD